VGHWALPDDQAAQLREFLLRGGFLMVDDFHGDQPTITFQRMEGVCRQHEQSLPGPSDRGSRKFQPDLSHDLRFKRSFPGGRLAIPLQRRTYEAGETGKNPHWRAIFDDKGRVMVAICHNMDLGDAWEWSDDARYPEKWASLSIASRMNYFIYDLSTETEPDITAMHRTEQFETDPLPESGTLAVGRVCHVPDAAHEAVGLVHGGTYSRDAALSSRDFSLPSNVSFIAYAALTRMPAGMDVLCRHPACLSVSSARSFSTLI